jgi:CrcB protein
MPTLFTIFLGAGLGGLSRYAMVTLAARLLGLAFPYGTLAVNVIGGLAIGFLAGLWAQHDASNLTRSFLITGILGGFTTFSAFTLDIYTLIERHQPLLALAYVLLSVVGALIALFLGLYLARFA